MSPVASFHLVRFARPSAATLARVPLDRRALAAVPGMRFARLLGTGAGATMSLSADLARWAVFAVWDDEASLGRFLDGHPLPRRWTGAAEAYHLTLEPAGAHGRWGGADPFAGIEAVRPDGPVAVLTRATLRPTRVRSFLGAVPPVDERLACAVGNVATVGIGETPGRHQGTFSLWRSPADVRAFAYDDPTHAEVVERTAAERWYSEEWFARFRPRHASGTWDGVDPLGDTLG